MVQLVLALQMAKQKCRGEESSLVAMHFVVNYPPGRGIDTAESKDNVGGQRVHEAHRNPDEDDWYCSGKSHVEDVVVLLVRVMPVASLVVQRHVVVAKTAQPLAFEELRHTHFVHQSAMHEILVDRKDHVGERKRYGEMQVNSHPWYVLISGAETLC